MEFMLVIRDKITRIEIFRNLFKDKWESFQKDKDKKAMRQKRVESGSPLSEQVERIHTSTKTKLFTKVGSKLGNISLKNHKKNKPQDQVSSSYQNQREEKSSFEEITMLDIKG